MFLILSDSLFFSNSLLFYLTIPLIMFINENTLLVLYNSSLSSSAFNYILCLISFQLINLLSLTVQIGRLYISFYLSHTFHEYIGTNYNNFNPMKLPYEILLYVCVNHLNAQNVFHNNYTQMVCL